MDTTNPDPAGDRPVPSGSLGPAPAKPHSPQGRRSFHGLEMTYLVGLALLVLGGGLIALTALGCFSLVDIALLIYGAALIARAIERLEGAPVGSLRSQSGGLLLIVGLLGAIALAAQCGAIVMWLPAGDPARARPPIPWYEYILIGSVCAVWPGVICAGAWLRRRPAWPTLRFLWLSLAATYPAIYVMGLALPLFLRLALSLLDLLLPRSLL